MPMSELLNRQLALIDNTTGIKKAIGQYKLGLWYEQGMHELSERPDLAIIWYKKAARNGHLEAQAMLPNAHYELAVKYQYGAYGVTQNINRAIYSYQFASRNGISEASYNLGCIYKDSEGLPLEEQGQAIQEALYYFKQAALQGDKDALSKIEEIYTEGLAQRPEFLKPHSVPEGFNRQNRRKLQTVTRKDDGTLAVVGRTTVPIQIAEPQPNAETAVLTPGFDHHRQSTSHNDTLDKPHGSKTALELSASQKENRQENRPSVPRKIPPVPVFRN